RMLLLDAYGRTVEVARARVVAEPRPEMQHLIDRRARHGAGVGKALEKACVVGNDSRDLGLLQHDLRHPYAVGRTIPLPRQVVSAGVRVPVDECGGDRRAKRVGLGHPLILTGRARGLSRPVAQLHVAAHCPQAHVTHPLTTAAREARPRAVLARVLGTRVEAVADIAAEARHLIRETAVGASADSEAAAHRAGFESRPVCEGTLEAQIAGGGAGAHRARAIERSDEFSIHRAGFYIPPEVLEWNIAPPADRSEPPVLP